MILDNVFGIENEKPLDKLAEDGGYTAIFRTIACVGDSLSSGEFQAVNSDGVDTYHDMFEYSWGQFLGRMCGSQVYNFSRGGMTAKEYCNRFADSMGYWNPTFASQAYIIAMGVNDLLCQNQKIGSMDDVDINDWKNNKDTFAGNYCKIIQRYKDIQPRAKFFLMTFPSAGENDPKKALREEFRDLLYKIAETFSNVYVLDFYKYAPVYDKEFNSKFSLRGHMNPMGYLLTAKMVGSYIDYIIRHNMDGFKEVGFIGTDLHGQI